ncbi:MAG: CHAP domain-containing protein [Myxococcota bacterium]|nr:CHAP domain-containing protein [Myxococcota bacterium]
MRGRRRRTEQQNSDNDANTNAVGNQGYQQPRGNAQRLEEVCTPSSEQNDELAPLLEGLENSSNATQRREAVVSLTNWCRDNLPDRTLLHGYMSRTDITDEEKTQTMGQLAVELAKNEFMVGWSYQGGVTGSSRNWETRGSNRGEFPTYYQEQMRTHGAANGAPWCTSFTGSIFDRLGFAFNEDTSEAQAKSIFWSGYRLTRWAKNGQSNSRKQLTPVTDIPGAEGSSGALIESADWRRLRTLIDVTPAEERLRVIQQFFEQQPTPQAGDIVVIGSNNTFRSNGRSHTMMIENYNAAEGTFTTIEGNADQAIGSRQIDLKIPSDARKMVSLIRMGAELMPHGDAVENAAAQSGEASPEMRQQEQQFIGWYSSIFANPIECGPQNVVTAENLLGHARSVNARIAGVAHGKGWIQSGDASDSAHTMQRGSNDTTRRNIHDG